MAKKARKTTKRTAKKTTKKKAVKRTVKKKKTTARKKTTKRKVTKKKVTRKKVTKKKVTRKKKVVKKKKTIKKRTIKKKAPARKQTIKRRKPGAPLFDRIVPTRPPEPATGDNPYHIKIVNMVASANFNVNLDLFALAREVDTIEYEPEQFPGAILKLQKPKSSLLLFKNGKVICTGARSEEDVEKALLRTTEIIAAFVS